MAFDKERIKHDKDRVTMARLLVQEYGEEALDALMAWRRERSKASWAKRAEEEGRNDPAYLKRLFTEKAHEFEVIEDSKKVLEVKVTRCVHAETFQSLGAADLGYKLICTGDDAVVEGFNPKMKLTRPEILMRGDPSCHFRFELTE